MTDIESRVRKCDWDLITHQLTDHGFAVIKNFLHRKECNALIRRFDKTDEYRKTVLMERYRFGMRSYKYWSNPLPETIHDMRKYLYPQLAPIANSWMELLKIENQFPNSLEAFLKECHKNDQKLPTPLILRYQKGGYNTLHQDLYGETYFPIQAACFLNESGEDFTGGHFVLTEQVPRAQSRAIVLTPKRGDLVIFSTNFRPAEGKRGYYRVIMKHGVSEVYSGTRHAVGVIFHDAKS